MKLFKKIVVPLLGILLFLSNNIEAQNKPTTQGESDIPVVTVKTSRDIDSFTGIIANGEFDIILYQGEKEAIIIEAEEKSASVINTEVRNGVLHISSYKKVKKEVIKVHITIKEINKIVAIGNVSISCKTKLSMNKGEIFISDLSDMNLQLTATELICEIQGASNVTLSGATQFLQVKASDEGYFHAFDLQANKVNIKVSGSGDVSLNVIDELEMTVTGKGNVYYIGEPIIKDQVVSGTGFIVKRKTK